VKYVVARHKLEIKCLCCVHENENGTRGGKKEASGERWLLPGGEAEREREKEHYTASEIYMTRLELALEYESL
jgi:hypothetical protein